MKDYKERWQEFFEEICEANPQMNLNLAMKLADDELANDEARLIDEAYERERDRLMLEGK